MARCRLCRLLVPPPWLIEQSPQHSIARDWAGGAARHHLTDEIRRLHDLLYRALNDLRKAGLDKEADRLERAMRP